MNSVDSIEQFSLATVCGGNIRLQTQSVGEKDDDLHMKSPELRTGCASNSSSGLAYLRQSDPVILAGLELISVEVVVSLYRTVHMGA